MDVFSLGHVLYEIVTGYPVYAFPGVKLDTFKHDIKRKWRPPLPKEVEGSQNKYMQAIVKAIQMCWIHRAKDRPSAKDVLEQLLKAKM